MLFGLKINRVALQRLAALGRVTHEAELGLGSARPLGRQIDAGHARPMAGEQGRDTAADTGTVERHGIPGEVAP